MQDTLLAIIAQLSCLAANKVYQPAVFCLCDASVVLCSSALNLFTKVHRRGAPTLETSFQGSVMVNNRFSLLSTLSNPCFLLVEQTTHCQ